METGISRIGYACLNLDVADSTYKTCRIDAATPQRLDELIDHNLEVLEGMIDYNIKHHITMFRISSSLIPFASSPVNTLDWQDRFQERIGSVREKIIGSGMRISVHPGQYTVLNALDPDIVQRAVAELEYHADILQSMGGDNQNSKMILHIGGIYGDKDAAMQRFVDVCHHQLSARIRKHLIIENDDRLYTIADVLAISRQTGLPVVFDNLHHHVNPPQADKTDTQWLQEAMATWRLEDGRPKMHYSQQAPNKRAGAHTDTIYIREFLDYYHILPQQPIDIMLEVKDKNRSALKVNAVLRDDARSAERAWSRYKYVVMGQSHAHYQALRKLFAQQPLNVAQCFSMIDEALLLPEDRKQQVNALEHAWGYFKKIATDMEKVRFFELLGRYRHEHEELKNVKRYLQRLSRKYEMTYLLNSYFFD